MKILYRRELHKTTPTNFLYHVRLTYWLPLQLLWAGLYLNLKGTQMGSPPAEHGGVSSCRSSPVCFSLTLALSSIRAATQVILEVEGFGKTEYNLIKTLDDSLHKAETEASVWSSLRSEPLLPLRQDTAGWLELYRLFMDLPGGLSMSRGSSERERERGWGHSTREEKRHREFYRVHLFKNRFKHKPTAAAAIIFESFSSPSVWIYGYAPDSVI